LIYIIYILEKMYDISILNRLEFLNIKHAKLANPGRIRFDGTPNVVNGASLLEQ
jgi:hypothetical protein